MSGRKKQFTKLDRCSCCVHVVMIGEDVGDSPLHSKCVVGDGKRGEMRAERKEREHAKPAFASPNATSLHLALTAPPIPIQRPRLTCFHLHTHKTKSELRAAYNNPTNEVAILYRMRASGMCFTRS